MHINRFCFKKLLSFVLFSQFIIFSSKANENNIILLDSLIISDEIPFFDNKNEKHYFDEYDNKTILVVFWATWCSSCVKEMPELDDLQKDFKKLPFKVIALSQDYKGLEALEQFYKNHELRYLDIFYDQRNSLFQDFKVVGLPSSFLIDHHGKVIATFKGVVNWYDEKIRKFILSHIAGTPPAPKNSHKQSLLNQISKETKDENKPALLPTKNENQLHNNAINDKDDQNKK